MPQVSSHHEFFEIYQNLEKFYSDTGRWQVSLSRATKVPLSLVQKSCLSLNSCDISNLKAAVVEQIVGENDSALSHIVAIDFSRSGAANNARGVYLIVSLFIRFNGMCSEGNNLIIFHNHNIYMESLTTNV